MNKNENELREKWDAINYYSGGALKLAINHSLEWYVRYATPVNKSIVIVCRKPTAKLDSSKCIEASCNQRKDGKYAITFTLMDSNKEDIFIKMVADIIDFSNHEVEEIALRKAVRRYNAWLKLLDHKNEALLGIDAQKGLIGELLFLKEKIEFGMPTVNALSGWVGPNGADQDFVYADCWHEIKTTGASSVVISISSIEQLDRKEKGELVIYRVDSCAPEQPGSITLYELVHSIIDLISCNGENVEAFILKLGSAGYIDMQEYNQQHFLKSEKQTYTVDKGFPRIRKKNIPSEITNAVYQIDIASIKRWEK